MRREQIVQIVGWSCWAGAAVAVCSWIVSAAAVSVLNSASSLFTVTTPGPRGPLLLGLLVGGTVFGARMCDVPQVVRWLWRVPLAIAAPTTGLLVMLSVWAGGFDLFELIGGHASWAAFAGHVWPNLVLVDVLASSAVVLMHCQPRAKLPVSQLMDDELPDSLALGRRGNCAEPLVHPE